MLEHTLSGVSSERVVLKLKKFWRFIKTTIISILAIYLVDKFNLLSLIFSFNPSFLFSACVAIYSGAIHLLLDAILDWYDNSMRSQIELVFFLDPENKDITNPQNVVFKELDVAEIKLGLHLKGKKKNFQDLRITFPYNNIYDVQFSKGYRKLIIKDKSTLSIDLNEFNIASTRSNQYIEFSIYFIKTTDYPTNEFECRPSLDDGKFLSISKLLCKFSCNYFILKDRKE